MSPKYLLTRYYKWSSQYQIPIKIDLVICDQTIYNFYQVYTKYANTNMAGTCIVCPIYAIIMGGARSDFVS